MTQPTKNKIPGPVYAAAGAGDLAYRKLRKLPAALNGLTGKAAAGTADLREKAIVNSAELREKAAAGTAELRERAAAGRAELREAAKRNAAALVAGAHVAQEKATAVYEQLVAHGARVIGGSAGTVSADAELESAGAAPALPATPGTAKPAKPAKKAAKRTRPAADK